MSVLAGGPFLKGLFFWTQLLGAIVLISLGFGMWLFGRRLGGLSPGVSVGAPVWRSVRKDWAGAGLLGLALCYGIQFFWADYPRGNLDVLLRVITAWFIYVMVSTESSPMLRRVFTATVALVACFAGLAGYLQYLGALNKFPRLAALLPWVQIPGQTVIGSFEYHNATAVLVLCGFILAVGLAVDFARPVMAGVFGGMATFLSLVFFFSQSRGAFVVLPFAVLALLAGLSSERRWQALMVMGTSILPALAFVRRIGDAITANHSVDAAWWTALASLLGCLGGLFMNAPLRLSPRLRIGVVCVLVVVALFATTLVGVGKQFLPKQAARYSEIDMEGASSRFRFYWDALKVFVTAPWGRGGWGWDRVYRTFQSTEYIAREVHNHYLQVAVEAGLPGLASLVAALAALLVRAWKNRREAGPGWALAVAGLALAGHSLIDFDLSYGYLWFLLWALFAAAARNPGAGLDAGIGPAPAADIAGVSLRRPDSRVAAVVGVVTLVTGILAGRLFLGSRLVDRIADLSLGADQVSLAQQVVKYDPWNTDALLALNTRPALDKAISLDPKNPAPHWRLCLWLEREYDAQGALKEAESALAVRPWTPDYYSKVADLRGTLMLDSLTKDQRDKTLSFASGVLDLRDEVARRTPVARQLKSWPSPIPQALFNLRCGQALFLSGRESDAIQPLKDAAKSKIISHEASLWLYAIYERAGDSKSKSALEGNPAVRLRSVNPVYAIIRGW